MLPGAFDVPLNELDDRFDMIFLAIGTWKESWVYQAGTELAGVYPALNFLEAVARGEDVPIGRKVVIIGGGNAAIDSARTALRKGSEVTVYPTGANARICLRSKKRRRRHGKKVRSLCFWPLRIA